MEKLNTLLLAMSTILSLSVGCQKTYHEEQKYGELFIPYFCCRECNYMWADNAIHFSDAPFHYKGFTGNSPIGLTSYLLEFNTCNVPLDSITFIPNYKENYLAGRIDCVDNPPFYALSNVGDCRIVEEALCDEPNENIERHLSKKFIREILTRSGFDYNDFMGPLDYRITPVSGIDVTASADLCGVKAGNSINDLLLIFGYYFSPSYDFILTSDTDVITDNIRDISISDFLSYDPMAPAQMFLRFRDGLSISQSVTISFTVTLTTKDGRTLTASTNEITLNP